MITNDVSTCPKCGGDLKYYEVLANIYKSRRNHKLDEWHTFCDWIEGLPYSALITGTAV